MGQKQINTKTTTKYTSHAQAKSPARSNEKHCESKETRMAKINCLLVEEQLMFADLLLPVLQSIPGLNLVVRAATGSEAIEKNTFIKPELLLVDFSLPDLLTAQVAEALHQHKPQARCIALSSQASSFACPPSLQPFLHAVVNKTSTLEKLCKEINLLIHASTDRTSPSNPTQAPPRNSNVPINLKAGATTTP